MTFRVGAGALSRISPHDEFLELCAISTSGQLTEAEHKRLQEHLAVCPSCREAKQQYEAVVSKAIPALAPDSENIESDPSWSQDQVEAALFERLAHEEESGTDRGRGKGEDVLAGLGAVLPPGSQATWRNVWVLYAAGIVLFIALGVCAYRVGIHRGTKMAVAMPPAGERNQFALEQQVSDAGHERAVLRAQVEERGKEIAALRRQLEQQSADMGRVRSAQEKLANDLRSGETSRQEAVRERSDLAQRLEAAQAKAQGLQERLDSLERQSAQDKQLATTLEARVNELNRQLHDRDAALSQREDLLAYDRDIRELMGARDLYIAEVYDVARDGKTKKPYGRVFYTKGKSLIFYAYDLDQQTEVKNASTFQVWGRRGPDRQQAFNLGIFYEDNAAKKRWVLKCADAKTLAQIDAVFVTVEPRGGSQKPSSKPLLFAYLRVDPNHP